MSDHLPLNAMADRAAAEVGAPGLRPVILKELLHYDILSCLDQSGFLAILTFHGGTALRLCYGAPRFSEDLDFAAGPDFTADRVDGMADALVDHLSSRYGLPVRVREPRRLSRPAGAVAVDTWQIIVETEPERKDLPRQRIKVDIATMEVRDDVLMPLLARYRVLPVGTGDLLIGVMSRDEILANKLVALPASIHQARIRYRDIWDIPWLLQNGAKIRSDWVAARAGEFDLPDFADRIDQTLDQLSHHLRDGSFTAEMRRFLPADTLSRTIERPGFLSYLEDVLRQSFGEVASRLARADYDDQEPGFRM